MGCKICNKPINGRVDKMFCSVACKNEYHVKLRRVTHAATKKIDTILHRNRAILLEIVGKNARQKKVPRLLLDRKKFNYKYMTGYYINSKGKTYNYIYDFAWMEFSDNEILIVRKKSDALLVENEFLNR
ncbi:MAG: hypothetical protein GY751_11750 [Bacteroidetes bacterium]|nr:hypothetical protein [Bacteroidota bacterium]